MRISSALVTLPALALAADQQPLGGLGDQVKGWFQQAQQYVEKNLPNVAPPQAAQQAAKEAFKTATDRATDAAVTHLTLDNWRSVLRAGAHSAAGEPEEWLVFITGGNSTCYGMCGRADTAWKEAVPLLKARPGGPRLAQVDCDEQQILCNCWATGPPSVYTMFLQRPSADQSAAQTPVYSTPLNRTSVSAADIVDIHAKEQYRQAGEYTGIFHPFDGPLAKYGLDVPLAYAMWGMNKMPSWLPMVLISVLSRTIMGRRMQPAPAQGAQGGAPAAR